MNVHTAILRRHNDRLMFDALVSLSHTQRRLAHTRKRQAIEAEKSGEMERYAWLRKESDRLWREAGIYLNMARNFRHAEEA